MADMEGYSVWFLSGGTERLAGLRWKWWVSGLIPKYVIITALSRPILCVLCFLIYPEEPTSVRYSLVSIYSSLVWVRVCVGPQREHDDALSYKRNPLSGSDFALFMHMQTTQGCSWIVCWLLPFLRPGHFLFIRTAFRFAPSKTRLRNA